MQTDQFRFEVRGNGQDRAGNDSRSGRAAARLQGAVDDVRGPEDEEGLLAALRRGLVVLDDTVHARLEQLVLVDALAWPRAVKSFSYPASPPPAYFISVAPYNTNRAA